jgi:DNA repair ATPase RecN
MTEIEQLTEKCQRLEEALQREESAHSNTIDQRDQHEEALNQVYFLVTGLSPEWSNIWGQQQLIEEVDDAQTLLRNTIRQLEADCATMRVELQKIESLGRSYIRNSSVHELINKYAQKALNPPTPTKQPAE